MTEKEFYYTFLDNGYQKFGFRDLINYCKRRKERIWSARLSTGLLGLTTCEAGRRGPKGYNEVLLAVGDEGLNKLVNLGFITCPVCRPDKVEGFWETIKESVKQKYNLDTLEDFIDKEILNFDARRIDWEEIMPVIGKTPNRLYVPRELSEEELVELKTRFERMGVELPPTGYYDSEAEGRFTEYKIPNF